MAAPASSSPAGRGSGGGDIRVAGISEIATETEGLIRLREATAALGETSMPDAGVHSAMPHEFTTAKLLASGELMWHCWLVSYRGYWVENVRTGIVSNEDGHADAYRALHESLLAGQDAARPGATAGDGFRAVMAC